MKLCFAKANATVGITMIVNREVKYLWYHKYCAAVSVVMIACVGYKWRDTLMSPLQRFVVYRCNVSFLRLSAGGPNVVSTNMVEVKILLRAFYYVTVGRWTKMQTKSWKSRQSKFMGCPCNGCAMQC